MSKIEPTIRINVDLTNPGQFFACCGLLELADRLWPGAEGWFEEGEFLIETRDDLPAIIGILKESGVSSYDEEGEPSIRPVRLDRFNLRLDWWICHDWPRFKGKPKKDRVGLMKTDLKFWAGNQTSVQITRALLKSVRTPRAGEDRDCFEPSELVSSRFGLDAAPAWTALDVGFSINEHPIKIRASATVELLAAIGLQRCRPQIREHGIEYATWNNPLRPAVLPAVVCEKMSIDGSTRYRALVIERGSYAAMSHSYSLKGDSRE